MWLLPDNFRIELYLMIIDSIIDDFSLRFDKESMQLLHLAHGIRWTLKSGRRGGSGERVRFHNYNNESNPLYILQNLHLFNNSISKWKLLVIVTIMLSYHIKFINVLDTHIYSISYMSISQWRRQDFGLGEGEHQTKFHTWIPLKSCAAMASPKLRFWKDIQQECTHQRLFKNFQKKFIKQFAQKFKKFSKIFQN